MTGDNNGTNGTGDSSDEWATVREADSIDAQAREMGKIARDRARERDKDIEDAVSGLVSSYLLKATADDSLRQLRELNEHYSESFYDGEANDEILDEYGDLEGKTEFWSDHMMAAHSRGLQWAILHEMNGGSDDMREVVSEDWSEGDEHGTSHHVCDCGNRLEWSSPEGCEHWKHDADDSRGRTWVCECGYEIHNATNAERSRHINGLTVDRTQAILNAVEENSQYGVEAREYYAQRAFGMNYMNVFTVAREEGYDPRTDDPEEIGRAVADSLAVWCNDTNSVPAEL